VLLAHPASAAHGIDGLKNACRRMIWFCPTWSAEQYDQALKRLHRPGQTRPVFSHQIVAKNTVDEIKVNRVAYKMQDQAEWARLIERVKKEITR
jgi:SNF2 family DNA or RNA helicase